MLEALKGMWAAVQGSFEGTDPCTRVLKMEVFVAHSFVVRVFSFLWCMTVKNDQQKHSGVKVKLHVCIYLQQCTLMHAHSETAKEKKDWFWLSYALCPAVLAISNLLLRLLWVHIPTSDHQTLCALTDCSVSFSCNQMVLDGLFLLQLLEYSF